MSLFFYFSSIIQIARTFNNVSRSNLNHFLIFDSMKCFKILFRPISYLTIASLLILSCDKTNNLPNPDLGLSYFPLKVNAVNVYKVDSTVYSDFTNTITEFQFLIKDTVINQFIDAQGNTAFRIERYKKVNTQDWTFQKVIAKKIVNNRAEEFVDNTRYVRLVFPATLESTWNGNLYNSLDEWKHQITSIEANSTVGTLKLDSTISIQQHSEINLIREDIYTESYTKNIGLVKKEVKAVDKDISSGKIKRGYRYTMQLNSHK